MLFNERYIIFFVEAVEIAVVECVVVSFEVQTKTMHNRSFRPVQLDAFVANSKAEKLPKQPKDIERRRPRCGVARIFHCDTVEIEKALQLYLLLHLFICAIPHRVRVRCDEPPRSSRRPAVPE